MIGSLTIPLSVRHATHFNITTAGIAKLLDNLKPHKAAGPDGLFPMVLWELSSVIASALQNIFSKSLSSHQRTGKKPW